MRRGRHAPTGTVRSAAGLVLALLLVGCGGGLPAWSDHSGGQVPSEDLWWVEGPREHCGWESATFLFIGRDGEVPGIPPEHYDQYIRDPEGIMPALATSFAADVEPPSGTEFTGYSAGGSELWIAPGYTDAVFIRREGRFERWPRVTLSHPLLCN